MHLVMAEATEGAIAEEAVVAILVVETHLTHFDQMMQAGLTFAISLGQN